MEPRYPKRKKRKITFVRLAGGRRGASIPSRQDDERRGFELRPPSTIRRPFDNRRVEGGFSVPRGPRTSSRCACARSGKSGAGPSLWSQQPRQAAPRPPFSELFDVGAGQGLHSDRNVFSPEPGGRQADSVRLTSTSSRPRPQAEASPPAHKPQRLGLERLFAGRRWSVVNQRGSGYGRRTPFGRHSRRGCTGFDGMTEEMVSTSRVRWPG